ncbi:hypothetical protein BWD42_04155 [Sphingobacterium sp. CZ-UAM]|uniref:hypothetical protein n=1 Tax=Sphingobacterium sp. CZ-UAM TaxID=1933868 RepID=UPI000987CA68|nr:hypothetical protein [Sphingobacterium sp. CZ-UAM]OOG19149.1 hypothetical protein BWD42_04155 [Sphingobacterium sp. CZ-UAM]
MTDLQKKLKDRWIENGYPVEKIQEVFKFMEDINENDHSNKWVVVPSMHFLTCVSDLTHSSLKYSFEEKTAQANLEYDIESDVTFAFYEKEGVLAWER